MARRPVVGGLWPSSAWIWEQKNERWYEAICKGGLAKQNFKDLYRVTRNSVSFMRILLKLDISMEIYVWSLLVSKMRYDLIGTNDIYCLNVSFNILWNILFLCFSVCQGSSPDWRHISCPFFIIGRISRLLLVRSALLNVTSTRATGYLPRNLSSHATDSEVWAYWTMNRAG